MATTVESATLKNANATFGTIELRYSTACHTAWARLTLNYAQYECGNASAGYDCAHAYVIRNKGMTSFAQADIDSAAGTANTRTAAY